MNTDAVFRDITEADYPLLPEFFYQTIPFEPGVELALPEVLDKPELSRYFQDFGGKQDCGIVAEIQGRVVGMAWTRLIKAYGFVDDQTPELVVSVLPEHQGKGIGTKLLERLFEVLTWHSFYRVSLSVNQSNQAVRLYRRLGFKVAKEDDEDFVMVKELAPESMEDFFAARVDIYDDHMLTEMELSRFYNDIPNWIESSRRDLRLLDLGCGTGLELEGLFKKYPDMQATGIDLSPEMLTRLEEKYPDKALDLVCASYFDVDFGEAYDAVLSVYSLHHFTEAQKLGLYRKIHEALVPGGVFINGDFTVTTPELKDLFMSQSIRIRTEHGITDGEFFHIDTPLTVETELRLLKEAGFTSIRVLHQETHASVIVAGA